MYDPFSLFLTNNIRLSESGEALLSCPHLLHTHHNSTNAAFNIHTGSYICFGKCGFKTSDIKKLSLWLNTECGLEARIQEFDVHNYHAVLAEEKVINNAREYIHLPLALNNDYLAKRRVTNETVKYFDLRHNDELIAAPNYDHENKLLGVNLRYFNRRGLRYRYVNSDSKQRRATFYPFSKVFEYDKEQTLYITEGMFGVFNLHQMGHQAVALLGSGGLQNLDALYGFNRVIVCVDNDANGESFWRKIHKLNNKKYYFPIFLAKPAEYDEIDAYDFEELTHTRNLTTNLSRIYDFFQY